MNTITFEVALSIVLQAREDGRRYANEVEPELLAAALVACYGYAAEHEVIWLAQTRKTGKGAHGSISTLGALRVPRNMFLAWLLNGRCFNVLGITDNGCLQVKRLAFTELDFGRGYKDLTWLPTNYHTWKDLPESESTCLGRRARTWEQVVCEALKAFYREYGIEVKRVQWIGGLNGVQVDIRVEFASGVVQLHEVKGYFGRIARFKK